MMSFGYELSMPNNNKKNSPFDIDVSMTETITIWVYMTLLVDYFLMSFSNDLLS